MLRTRKSKLKVFGLVVLLAILIGVRVVAPRYILKSLNDHLATFSPVYSVHIQDLKLSFLRMAYTFRNTEAHLKSDGHLFLKVEQIDVSIAWRQLLHGRILTDVVLDGADFLLTKKLLEGSKTPEAAPKEDANHVADKLFPVKISRVELHRSSFQFANLINQPESLRWRVSSIEGRVLNVNPDKEVPFTFFTLQGTMLDSAVFKMAGKAKREEDPMPWKADLELKGFDLLAANPMLMESVPLSFTKGKMDLYAEAISTGGEVRGYVKPFFHDLHVIGNKSDFKSVKHFAIEILTAMADAILRKPDDKTLAMRVPFTMAQGQLHVDRAAALSSAIGHGFGDPLSPSIEDKYDLN